MDRIMSPYKLGATRCNPCTANSIRGLGSKGVSADECVCNAVRRCRLTPPSG